MTTLSDRLVRWSGPAAVVLAATALGVSLWSAPAAAPSTRAAADSAPRAASPAPVPAPPSEERPAPVAAPSAATPLASASAPSAPSEARSASDEQADARPLKLKRLVVTTEIKGREPVAMERVPVGGAPVVAFVEVENPRSTDTAIIVTFERADADPVGHIRLPVPGESPRWRTWGRTQMVKAEGEWTAVVRDAAGKVLGSTKFTAVAG